MDKQPTILNCENLSIGYNGKAITEKVTFCVARGDYLCIFGENGSGKSTLMRTLLGLQEKISGDITFAKDFKKTDIGYLPQTNVIQSDFPASVQEVILSGCLNKRGFRPFYNKKERINVIKNAKIVGVENLLKRSFKELSGGQQQRVLLARALMATEKIILVDEPVAGLDPEATKSMYECLKSLNTNGITIIMISHDLGVAEKDATHIMKLGDGKVLFYGTSKEFIGGSSNE